jgi:mannosyltransferase
MRRAATATYLLRCFPLLLFAVNFATKLAFLTSEEIGLDEPFSIYHAQFTLPVIISHLENYNNPPLFEILLHFWVKLFGISPVSVRLLPMLIACFCPVALFFFAKRNFSVRVAFVSSLLLSFSQLLLYYSHDCRVYTLFVLLSILSVHFYFAAIESGKMFACAMFVVTSALLIYSHYFGFFVLFFEIVHLVGFRRRHLTPFVVCFVAIGVLYLPHLYPLLARMGDSVSRGTWVEPPSGIESLYNSLWAFSNFPFITVGCIALLVFSLAALVVKRRNLWLNHKVVFIVLWFLFAYIGMFVVSYRLPVYINRYLIYALPAYYILLGVCINFLFSSESVRTAAAICLVGSFALTLDLNPDKKQPVSELMEIIRRQKTDSTMVVVNPQSFIPVFAYHYDRELFALVSDPREYYQVDSALRSRGVYHISDPAFLPEANLPAALIYLAQGKERAVASNGVYERLMRTYELRRRQTVGDNWAVVFMAGRK